MRNTKKIKALILLITFTTMFLITSIYAWMSSQKNVAINNMEARVEVAEGLQISLDADNWSQEIALGETTREGGLLSRLTGVTSNWKEYDLGIGNGAEEWKKTRNVRPKLTVDELTGEVLETAKLSQNESIGYMLPMSTTGVLDANEENVEMFKGNLQGESKLSQISKVTEDSEAGYYAFDIYLLNTSKESMTVNQLQLNLNSIVEEIKSSSETEDYGLKNSVRVGFALYDKTSDISASKNQILDDMKDGKIEKFAIWEPNADMHSEFVMKQNQELRDLINEIENGENLETYALNPVPTGNTIANVYETSGGNIELQKTMQTSGVTTIKEINDEEVLVRTGSIINMTDTTDQPFNIKANKISKVRIYIWLEGQDADCLNWASHSDGINVTIGLTKDNEVGNIASWTPTSNGAYKFTKNGNKWTSNNSGADDSNATTTWGLNLAKDTEYSIKYKVSSENSKFSLTLDEEKIVDEVTNTETEQTYSTTLESGTHTLVASFAKTSSQSTKNDSAYIILPDVDEAPIVITLSEGLAVGDTVEYSPSGTYTWQAQYSGYDTDQSMSSASEPRFRVTNWKELNIDEGTGKIDLIASAPTSGMVYLQGANGYNNAVKLLNDACSSL